MRGRGRKRAERSERGEASVKREVMKREEGRVQRREGRQERDERRVRREEI